VAYAIGALATFFSQHLVSLVLSRIQTQTVIFDWQSIPVPLRSQYWTNVETVTWWVPMVALPLTVIVSWALAALSFRRATTSNSDPWIAAATIVPMVQLPAILFLCAMPDRKHEVSEPIVLRTRSVWSIATEGMLSGATFTVLSVALGALVFGSYGYGIFVLSPLMIGAMTAYIANRQTDIGVGPTATFALGATALGGLALFAVALEGVVCLVLAFPLTAGLALLGGMLGRAIARSRQTTTLSFMSIALLPITFGAERTLPPVASFESYQAIEIAASPELVWQSIVEMKPIDSPPPLLFRLGVSYPVGGRFMGSGIGAMRRGEFSTGVAMERVTEWVANERLGLEVLSNPPAMRELSPYEHVHAPHVSGYFETKSMSFEIVQRADATLLVERTSHELKLDPLWYWLPMAKWMVGQNNARVLAHIKRQAEQSALSEKL